MRRLLTIVAVLFGCALLPSGAASARSVPPSFFGVMANGPLDEPSIDLVAEDAVMRSAGVETIRLPMQWSRLQPYRTAADIRPADAARFTVARGTPMDFTAMDVRIGAAARNGLDVLGLILETPSWAARDAGNVFSPPRDPADYARAVLALIDRYGPKGSFWTANPSIPKRPVRHWQLWNEPSLPRYFAVKGSWATAYAQLLRPAYATAKAADPGSTVVSAGLPNFSWRDVDALYRAKSILKLRGRLFDAVAIHPFTGRPADSVRILRRVRAVMDRHRDRTTPIWVTEVSWPSGRGRAVSNQRWVTTQAGEATKVREVYTAYAAAWKSLRLARAYWYAWATLDRDSPNAFDYAGLRTYTRAGAFEDKPAIGAYRAITRRLTR